MTDLKIGFSLKNAASDNCLSQSFYVFSIYLVYIFSIVLTIFILKVNFQI